MQIEQHQEYTDPALTGGAPLWLGIDENPDTGGGGPGRKKKPAAKKAAKKKAPAKKKK